MGRYSKKQLAEMVYSEDADLRIKAARHGQGLDALVNDSNYGVRAQVAEQGYGLATLVDDDYYWVRVCVAEQGYGLDKLLHDESWMVRAAVAEQRYGLDLLINDPNPCVRATVAQQGHGLDVLINDPDFGVRQCVAKQGYGLDLLAKDPDSRVRMVVKDVLAAMRRYSKYNIDDLVQMREKALSAYRKRAATPEQTETAAKKYDALCLEINRRGCVTTPEKPPLEAAIQSASTRVAAFRATPQTKPAKEPEPDI